MKDDSQSSSSKAGPSHMRVNTIFLKEKLEQIRRSRKCFVNSSSDIHRAVQVSRFAGKDVSQPLCIEVYAGTARLSRAMKDVGFRTLAIDKTMSRTEDTICILQLMT